MEKINELYGGRIFNVKDFTPSQLNYLIKNGSRLLEATVKKNNKLFCRRCLMEITKLPIPYQYCRNCINLGNKLMASESF